MEILRFGLPLRGLRDTAEERFDKLSAARRLLELPLRFAQSFGSE